MDCDHCGRDLAGLPYTCKRCQQRFCTEHRLPEVHNCIQFKLEKAERELKREEGNVEPWFKDEFRLSNVEDQDERSSSDRIPDDPITTENKYRAAHASEECTKCGTALFEYEAAGCPHCGELYCGDHLAKHRRNCDYRDAESAESTKTVTEHYHTRTEKRQERRKTRTDELEDERRERFSSPNVNLDGSLSKPNYEEDIESINPEDTDSAEPAGSNKILKLMIVLSTVALVGYLGYLFIL